jgi:hypothetical protein
MTGKLLSIAACAVVACAFSTSPSAAQSNDGTWRGQLHCNKLSFTKGPQNVPLTLTVSGGSASFTRQVYNPDNTQVMGTEEGSGTVSGNQIKLSSKWNSPTGRSAYTASYSGTMAGGAANLHGTQAWTLDGKPESRSCSISLRK